LSKAFNLKFETIFLNKKRVKQQSAPIHDGGNKNVFKQRVIIRNGKNERGDRLGEILCKRVTHHYKNHNQQVNNAVVAQKPPTVYFTHV
jgi:hypothetical protein